MSKGTFINFYLPYKHASAKDQAESILKKAEELIAKGGSGVAITYSANYGQTRKIEKVYAAGGWNTGTGGANQAEVISNMEHLLGSSYQDLQGKMHISPITTMNAYDVPVNPWNDDVLLGIVKTDLDRIKTSYLEKGWDVLGWQNEDKLTKNKQYAVGGATSGALPEAVNDAIQNTLGEYAKDYLPTPNPKSVTINGAAYDLVAFYYPDHDTAWDAVYQGQFLTNFFPCRITLTINGISGSFYNAEAAFQATKWWSDDSIRKQFENAKTGSQAFSIKKGLTGEDSSYAGLGGDGAMKKVLTEKFSDSSFKQALLLTGKAYLLEHNEAKGRDHAGWSDDQDGHSQNPSAKLNRLGETLMEVRESLGGAGRPSGNYTLADFSAAVES